VENSGGKTCEQVWNEIPPGSIVHFTELDRMVVKLADSEELRSAYMCATVGPHQGYLNHVSFYCLMHDYYAGQFEVAPIDSSKHEQKSALGNL
jgi:hypothetical protein